MNSMEECTTLLNELNNIQPGYSIEMYPERVLLYNHQPQHIYTDEKDLIFLLKIKISRLKREFNYIQYLLNEFIEKNKQAYKDSNAFNTTAIWTVERFNEKYIIKKNGFRIFDFLNHSTAVNYFKEALKHLESVIKYKIIAENRKEEVYLNLKDTVKRKELNLINIIKRTEFINLIDSLNNIYEKIQENSIIKRKYKYIILEDEIRIFNCTETISFFDHISTFHFNTIEQAINYVNLEINHYKNILENNSKNILESNSKIKVTSEQAEIYFLLNKFQKLLKKIHPEVILNYTIDFTIEGIKLKKDGRRLFQFQTAKLAIDFLKRRIKHLKEDYKNVPTKYIRKDYNGQKLPIGRYLVVRKDGKIHFENYNGLQWAYNDNSIVAYYEPIYE